MKHKLFFNKLWLRVGMIVAIMTTALSGTAWAETAASFSRSGTSNTTTGGTFSTSFSAKTGYYQDNNGDCYMQILSNSAYWTTTPASISLAAKIGGGSGNTDLTDPVYVVLLDNSGNEISTTKTSITNHITTSNGDDYNISIPVANNVYGVKISHNKQSGFNVRYFSFSLSYTTSGGTPTPTTYTVTYNANGGTGTMTDNNSYEEGDEVTLLANTFTAPSDKVWDSWLVKDASNNTVSVSNNKFNMPASNVTVTAQWVDDPNAPEYEWVETNLSDLTASDIFVIVGNNYAMTNNNGTSSAPATSAVTVASSKITSTVTDNIKWNVSGNATDGYTFFPNGSTTTWLYCNTDADSGNNNNMRVGTGGRKVFELNNSGYLITKDNKVVRYLSIYNNADWRGYINTSNGAVALKFYKRQVVSNDPAIYADNVNILYDATSGSIDYTLENATGNVSATITSGDWLTLGTITADEVPFTCEANTGAERTATVTLSFSGAENKVVTVTQAAAPVTYTTIPDLFAAATSTETNVNVTFNNWVVSGVHNNNVFLTDNQGNGLIIYTSNHGFAVNDKLSGTVSETPLKLYNGFAEFTNLTASTSGLTVTKDGEITVITNKTIAELGGVNTGAVITLSNLTYDGTNLSDGTNTIKPYNSLYSEMSLTSGTSYNITGVYQQYSNTKEILPRSAADIVEVQVQHNEYDLTVSNLENVELFVFDAADDSNSLLDGEGTIQVYDGTAVMISVSAESGYVLESLTVDGNDVTSQIDESGAYTFTMPTHDVTITATAVASSVTPASVASVTFDFTDTAWGFPADYVTSEADYTYDGYTFTLGAVTTGGHKAMTSGSGANLKQTALIFGKEEGATLTFPAFPFNVSKIVVNGPASGASGKVTQNIFVGDVAVSTETTGANGTLTYDINENYQTAGNVYVLKLTNANNSQICSIEVFGYESVTVTDAGYATYCSENALDFTDTDIKAYVGTKNGDKLTFTSIKQVPANTGLLLVYEGGKTEDVPVIASATAVEGNCLVGVNAETTISSNDYILNKVNDGVGFYKAGDYTTLGAHKAYIPAAVGNGVKGFTIDFDDDATGISDLKDSKDLNDSKVIYNLAGQRTSKMQKGINIVNGKKVLK